MIENNYFANKKKFKKGLWHLQIYFCHFNLSNQIKLLL